MTDVGHADAARARGGAAGRKQKEKDNRGDFTNEQQGRQARLRSWEEVNHRTAQLAAVADFKAHLLSQIRWAELKMEVGITDLAELDHLRGAAEDLRLVSAAIHGRRT